MKTPMDYKLPRQEVSFIVDELIKGLTPNDVLQKRTEMTYENELIQTSVGFIEGSEKAGRETKRFRISVTTADQSRYAVVALEGIYPVFNMIPKVRETLYTALVPDETMRPVPLNETPYISDDVFLRLVPSADYKYRRALTRAMQIMRGVEKELARKFES